MALEKEDIMALIAILQKGLEDDSPVETKSKSTRKKRTTPKTKTKKTERENKFLSMKEKDMHKSDVEIDRKLNVSPPTERTRQFKPIVVQCRVCGKKETINPAYVDSVERYKCNKCSTSAG